MPYLILSNLTEDGQMEGVQGKVWGIAIDAIWGRRGSIEQVFGITLAVGGWLVPDIKDRYLKASSQAGDGVHLNVEGAHHWCRVGGWW